MTQPRARSLTLVSGLTKLSKAIPRVHRRPTKLQTLLVAVTRAHQVAAMWFAASTDRTAYLLDIDGDELVKKRTVWILVAVAVVVAISWWGSGQLKIDSCLDSGGRWNYELGICER